MHGSILQINISNGGIPKLPIEEAELTPLGLAGDRHAHPDIHGGPRRALLLITAEGIEELKDAGFPLQWGTLGENITTRGLDRRLVRIGQRYRLGQAAIEITKVRSPCETLATIGSGIQKAVYDPQVKAGEPSSPRWGLSGFYASVVLPGRIRPGDPIMLLDEIA